MVRTRCCGIIDEEPACKKFFAENLRAEEVILCLEEFEALRLKDYDGLDQTEAAQTMGLTRPTYQRILQSARRKVAEALVKGNHMYIQGGYYKMANRVFECQECQHVWEVPPCNEGGKHGYEIECPSCSSLKKIKIMNGERHVCGGGHHAHGGGHSHGGGCCGGHHGS